MTTALRPLTTGELLDRTFSLYRSHFALFVGIFALPHLCVLAFRCVGLAYEPATRAFSSQAIFSMMIWTWGAALLSLVFSAVSHAATVVAVSQVHLDRPAGVLDSYSRIRKMIGGVIGLSLLIDLSVFFGCILLVVPGVLLALQWSLAVAVKVLEDKGIGDSLSRSAQLTQGNRGRIFVIWLLFVALAIGVGMLLQWPVKMAAGVSGTLALGRTAVGWRVASLVASFISECLVGPLATIAFALVYYDQRVRKEGFDLQLMMATLDSPALQIAPMQAGA